MQMHDLLAIAAYVVVTVTTMFVRLVDCSSECELKQGKLLSCTFVFVFIFLQSTDMSVPGSL